MNSQNVMENQLPSVLQTNATDENQSSQIESVIQEADNHSWVSNRFGKSKWVVAKKGSALATDGMLIWIDFVLLLELVGVLI